MWMYHSLFNHFPVVRVLRNAGLRATDKYPKFPPRKTVPIYIPTKGVKEIHFPERLPILNLSLVKQNKMFANLISEKSIPLLL